MHRPTLLVVIVVLAAGVTLSFTHPPPIELSSYCNGTDAIDDTGCIATWILAGKNSPGSTLRASDGIYLYNQPADFYAGMHLECTGPARVTFKNTGGPGTFLQATTAVKTVRVRNCGFDVNGNPANFLAVLSINPGGSTPSSDIRITRNRIRDGAIPGQMSASQRQYILLLNCVDCRAEENHLSEGGRIKLGRPGRQLAILRNIVEHANDNAITVVDIGSGTSQDILIEGNRVVQPKGVGIFFGADGEGQTDPALTARRVHVRDNQVTGDWATACILGTLPEIADDIRIHGNTCVKTGTGGTFQAGIVVKRVNNPSHRATNIKIEHNRVSHPGCVPSGTVAPLDLGGLFMSGIYDRVEVRRNEVRDVGPRAMFFNSIDIMHGRIVNNTLVGGVRVISGTIQGTLAPNTIVANAC